jgi:hypothetical protein
MKKCRRRTPWEAVSEVRERPLSMQKTLTAGPLEDGARVSGAPTINVKNVNGEPLGGDAEGPGAPTINTKNVDGGLPGRRCRRSRSAHHQRKKHRRQAPWEAVQEVRERSSSTQKTSMVAPLGGGAKGPKAPTINAKMSMVDPLRGGAVGPGASTINAKNVDAGPLERLCQRSGSTTT